MYDTSELSPIPDENDVKATPNRAKNREFDIPTSISPSAAVNTVIIIRILENTG